MIPARQLPFSMAFEVSCNGRRYTLRLSSHAALASCAIAGASLLALIGALLFLAFGDPLLVSIMRQRGIERAAYEDRITVLGHKVDQLSSRQMLDQAARETGLEELALRQSVIEKRQTMLAELIGVRLPRPVTTTAKPANHAEILQHDFNALEASQQRMIATLIVRTENQSAHLSNVLAGLRLPAVNAKRPAPDVAMGGPFIPAVGFEADIGTLKAARAENERLMRLVSVLPLKHPLDADPEVTSGFGVRRDPFTGRQALHSGLDLKLEPGAPALATASGTVSIADFADGYGKMVEIDHGNGITTRYGHLARILVKEGQTVESGAQIGTVGSTGRSTGPHLHYETRVNDEAVDPLRFMRAGERLRRGLAGASWEMSARDP